MLNSNVAPYVSLFIWRLLNSPDVIEMPKGPISKWLFASGNIFVPAISVTLDTQAFPNINKENLAFLSWNPMSQVHFLCANKYPQFTNRNLKPALQLSRLYQGHCHPRTPIGQDIWLPPMDSWASGRKHWVSNWQLRHPSDSSTLCFKSLNPQAWRPTQGLIWGWLSHLHGDWHSGMTDWCHPIHVYRDDVAAIRPRQAQRNHSELQCSWAWQNRLGHCSHRGILFFSRWGHRHKTAISNIILKARMQEGIWAGIKILRRENPKLQRGACLWGMQKEDGFRWTAKDRRELGKRKWASFPFPYFFDIK